MKLSFFFFFSLGGLTNVSISPDSSLCNSKVLSFLVRWNTKISNDDYCNCRSICLPPPPLSPPKHPSSPILNNLPSADFSWVFLMQLCRAACYWFPWWVSKINIKVCDSRVAYWFKKSRGCSHNVSTFDLWPVFMFFDNMADCGCDCGWSEETVGLSLVAYRLSRHPSTPSIHSLRLPQTSSLWNAVPARIVGNDIQYEMFCTWG